MSNKPLLLIAALLAIITWVGLSEASRDDAVGARGGVEAQMTYRQEGDAAGRSFFSISCANNAWTAVVSSEPTRRSITFIALSANSGGVCLSSAAATEACDDGMEGPELGPGSSLTDYTTGGWDCRSRSGNTDRIKGYAARNTLDR